MYLSPREIQSRIRAGGSPEEVADAAGCDLASIEGFVLPILGEREHMAELARSTPVRLRYGQDRLMPLGELLAHETPPALWSAVTWDAWRREDALWTVRASYPDGRNADFAYDPRGRFVVADSPTAFELVGDLSHEDHTALMDSVNSDPADREDTVQIARPPLAAAPADEPRDEIRSIDDAPPAPVRNLKEVRDRKAMDQLTIDLDLPETPPTHPEPVAPQRPKAPKTPTSWTEMLFGSND